MKEVNLANGGRPFYNEDLETLQETLFTLEKSFSSFQSQGFVLSGCEILSVNPIQNQVSEGLVCIGGKILKLDNAVYQNNVPNFIIADAPEDTDARTYENGASQNSTRVYKAIISTTNNNGIALPADPNTQLSTIWELIRNQREEKGSIKIISKIAFLEFFDLNTGLGFGKWLGWAWCDGRNDTEDLAGYFVRGFKTLPPPIENSFLGFTGGNESITLQPNQTPQKEIRFTVKEAIHNGGRVPASANGSDPLSITPTDREIVINATPAQNAIEILPPYRWLPYVQKIS